MKKIRQFASILMLAAAVVFAAGCTKPDDPSNGDNGGNDNGGGNNEEPTSVTIRANTPSMVKLTNARLGAVATVPDDSKYVNIGICWGIEENPTITPWPNNSIFAEEGVLSFDTLIFKFDPGTTYHVRAFVRYNGEELYSDDVSFTTVSVTDMSIYESISGHPYVDLGLPSGTKWAVYNVGAFSPIEYGSYFAWGETVEKSECTWDNYKFGNYIQDDSPSKYNNSDNLLTLEPEDDAVSVNWMGGWRTPTSAECYELKDNVLRKAWVTVGEVSGALMTFANGNSLFLPAGGRKEATVGWNNKYCCYGTSTHPTYSEEINSFQWFMMELSITQYDGPKIQSLMRDSGYSYRGVHAAK